MTKRQRQDRTSRRTDNRAPAFERESFSLGSTRPVKEMTLTARSPRQKTYLAQIDTQELIFGLGPAGTGKTYVAAWKAGDALEKGLCKKIVVTRPLVEAGEKLGFLPGDVNEKVGPYFVPMYEALCSRIGKSKVDYLMDENVKGIEFVPFALMRGRTFDDAYVILDEAQNTTPSQMKMFLTRAGQRSKLIVNGDLLQSDIEGPSGLKDAVEKFRDRPGVGITIFKRDDVVRSGLAALAVAVYEDDDTREQCEALGKLPDFITRPSNDDQPRLFD